jgi:hypothetical protein
MRQIGLMLAIGMLTPLAAGEGGRVRSLLRLASVLTAGSGRFRQTENFGFCSVRADYVLGRRVVGNRRRCGTSPLQERTKEIRTFGSQ